MTTKVVTVANQAGSAGKSTLVTSLAALLGKNVIVWDLDPQANATTWMGIDPDTAVATSGDVLLRRQPVAEALVESPVVAGVWVVPGHQDLAVDLQELQNQASGVLRLRRPLAEAVEQVGAEVVLIDCPGSMTLLTWCALAVSTAAVTVTTPAQKEISGVAPFIATVAQVADELETKAEVAAIVPSIVPPANAGRVYVEALDWLREAYPSLLTPGVRRAAVVTTAASHSEPVTSFAPDEPVAQDFRDVLADLRSRGVL